MDRGPVAGEQQPLSRPYSALIVRRSRFTVLCSVWGGGPIESDLAAAGLKVFSNAKNHRYDDSQLTTQSALPLSSYLAPAIDSSRLLDYVRGFVVFRVLSCSYLNSSRERGSLGHHSSPAASEGLAEGRLHRH